MIDSSKPLFGMDCSDLDEPLSYRDFQQVWNLALKQSGEDRVIRACQRCSGRHVKCDGGMPCQRCMRVGVNCIYNKKPRRAKETTDDDDDEEYKSELEEKDEARMLEMIRVASILEKRANEMRVEIENLSRGASEMNTCLNNQTALTHSKERKSKPWMITLKKGGLRIQTDINNTHQLCDFLAHFVSPKEIHRGPTTVFPVGNRAMVLRPSTMWPKWFLKFEERCQHYMAMVPPREDKTIRAPSLVILPNLEERLLDIILDQAAECGLWSQYRLSERFLACKHAYRWQSQQSMAHCYAIAALSTQHVFKHHINASVLNLTANFDAVELSELYFAKARSLLIDEILESESENLTEDVIHAFVIILRYIFENLSHRHLATPTLSLALRVAMQLDYHKPLRRAPDSMAISPQTLERAILWNFLVSMDQFLKPICPLYRPTSNYTCLNLLDITVATPKDMPRDQLQRLYHCLYYAKHTAICRDYLNALWCDRESKPIPTKNDLDLFTATFARWESELPPLLQIDLCRPTAYTSRASYLLALNLHLTHQAALIDLYNPFLPRVGHLMLTPTDSHEVERACSNAALMGTRMMLAYVRAGGCEFPLNVYPVVCSAHVQLAESEDEEIRWQNRAAIIRAMRIVRKTRQYEAGKELVVGLAKFLEAAVMKQGIKAKEEVQVFGGQDDEELID
ncbi:hypothetical protein BC937DRAFT_94569 [Endogone sp. FLAS-F59071]|nr:hypothetical protein BC937DRAFT_94569 [Endogone sp. FLAS-F59071]|eukprot:RUS13944.1 hypothetical protein BC937DRAFT_94569 [Endogone sp. FLAS-F59071]